MSTLERRRSSIFARARDSFYRSHGTRGANVTTLRGNAGSDFESEAIVKRSNKYTGLFSCFACKKGSKKKYILIKGPHVFVFTKATSSAPKYAIPLKHETVQMHDKRGNNQVVTLSNGLGEVEYEFQFDLKENKDLGKNFGRILKEQIDFGNTDEIKEKLGHELLQNSKSLKYAKEIGEEKERDQPDVGVATTDDVLGNYSYLQPY